MTLVYSKRSGQIKSSASSDPRPDLPGGDPDRRRMDRKSLKTPQLARTDLDLHLIQNRPQFFLRDSKFFGNLKTDGAGNFSLSGLL
jgi:hypothetical protein